MHGEVVLIAGASGRLGEGVTRAFAREGARIGLVARHAGPLQSLVTELGLPPERAIWHLADASVPAQAAEAVEHVREAFDRIDVLLNLVGAWEGGTRLAELKDAQWDEMLATNLHAAFCLSRAVLQVMLPQGGGRIIHIGSRAVERPGVGQAPYNVAKAGLLALTRSIAADYGADGIRANMILPATIANPGRHPESAHAKARDSVRPEDLAEAMLFLCSSAGNAINGAAIPVYGGRLI